MSRTVSTPYRYTPRAPAAPRPTPISATHEGVAQRRATRAPTVNPFDGFTQNDFESWIAGMTGALRRSLGQDVDVGQPAPQETATPQPEVVEGTATAVVYQPVGIDTQEGDDDYFEDSFANIKARRASSKGKGRDPLEGPGLYKGSGRQQDEPIEVSSGSEEDEVEEYEGQDEICSLPKRYVESEEEEGEGDGDDVEQYDDEGSQDFLEDDEYRAGSPHIGRHKDFAAHKEEILRAMRGYGLHEDAGEYEEYGSSDSEEVPQQRHNGRQASPEVIELDLDDDDDDEPRPVSGQPLKDEHRELHGSSPPIMGEDDGRDMLDEDEEPYFFEKAKEWESEDVRSKNVSVDIRSEEEVQPLDHNDAFPLRTRESVEADFEAPDIRDAWSGPRTYAEDFYSSGDRPFRHGHVLDAHHIEDEGEGGEDVETSDKDEDRIFVPEHPEQDEHPAQVQLRDVWEGPETYAEDYYSAGSLIPGAEQAAKPDRLGPELLDGEPEIMQVDCNDEGVEALPPTSIPLADSRVAQQQASPPSGASLAEEVPDQHASSGAFQGTRDGGSDAIEAVIELQDGPMVSDTELIDADLDLEYPEISRAPSVGIEDIPLEETSHSVTRLDTVVPTEDAIPFESVEDDVKGMIVTEPRCAVADTDRGETVEEENIILDVADRVSLGGADRTQTEDEHTAVITPEETDSRISSEVQDMACDSEAEDTVMFGVEPSSICTKLSDDQPSEETQVEEHRAAEVVDHCESENLLGTHDHGIVSTTHHSVTLEEVTDEDVEEPIQNPATSEIIADGGYDDKIGVLHGKEVASGEPLWNEVAGNEGMDDHDEDAYGEPENEDMEVLSITSSDDFLVLPHAEDGGEVEEPSQGDVTMSFDAEGEVLVPGGQATSNTQEVRPLVVFEGPVTSATLEETQDGVDERVSGDSSSSPASKGSKELFDDGSPGEPALLSLGEAESGLRADDSGDGGISCAVALEFEQPPETMLDETEGSIVEVFVMDSANTLGQVREGLGQGRPAEAPALALDDVIDMQGLDASAAQEEVALSTQNEPPFEGELPMADGFVSVRATSPPESIPEEETVPTVPDVVPQTHSGSEIPPEQLASAPSAATVRAGTPEVTHSINSVSTSVFERHSPALLTERDTSPIAVCGSSQVPTGPASPSRAFSVPPQPTSNGSLMEPTVDGQDIPAIRDKPSGSEAAQSTGAETITEDMVENQKESDEPGVNHVPSPQHIAEVEIVVDTGSNNGERRGSEPHPTIACSETKPAPSEASEQTSSTQLEPSTDVETVGVSVEHEISPPARKVSTPAKGSLVQPPSTGPPQEPPADHGDLDAAAANLLDNPPPGPAPKFRTISQPPSQTSTIESTAKGNAAKRKRDGFSPKSGPRGGAGGRKKSAKGKGKERQMDDAHLDGEEIIALPRKRSKLTESHLASVSERPRPPVSTSATSVQSGSSASSAARLLQPSSRASSVAPSEASGQTQPSPTTSKPPGFPKSQKGSGGFVHYNLAADSQPQAPSPLLQATSAAQRPFLHAHGKRKAPQPLQTYRTMPAPAPVVQRAAIPPQTATQAPPLHLPPADQNQHVHARRSSAAQRSSIPPVSPSSSHPPTSPQQDAPPQTPTASIGQLSQAPTPQGPASGARRTQSMKVASSAAHTPVTRSHCRFHKISLPKEELGPRIFFIVPGCSLTRYRVIEDEEVEDHGDATYEESQRMVEDIETLDLDPYIIKVLKSLVGSEIMQQREIYYLPLPGESVVRQASTSTVHATSNASKGRAPGTTYTSISARGRIGGETTLEELGISETDSDDQSSDDSDYNAKPVTRTKQTARRGAAPRKPTKASNKRSRAPVTQDPMQVDEVEEGRVGKKAKLDDPSSIMQPGPVIGDHT